MQDNIEWNPYDRKNLPMPIAYGKQRYMELAIIPMYKVEVCLYHKPFIGWKQYQLSKDLKLEMQKWLQGVEGRNKNFRKCKGLQGKDRQCNFCFTFFLS